jgi:hypothetical protein
MVGGHGVRGETFQLLFFASRHCVIILIFWLRFCPSRKNCRPCTFFMNIPNYARETATVRYPWNKTASMPSFTGLPPHVSILSQIESPKVALNEAMKSIIDGVKADLDGQRLGLQSYFDKKEIIQKMGELHGELLRWVEVVSPRSATTLQAGNEGGLEVTVGGSTSVSSLSDSAGAAITLVVQDSGKKINSFTPQVPCHVFWLILFFRRCL